MSKVSLSFLLLCSVTADSLFTPTLSTVDEEDFALALAPTSRFELRLISFSLNGILTGFTDSWEVFRVVSGKADVSCSLSNCLASGLFKSS